MATKLYEVVAKPGKEVFGHFQGERFYATLNDGEEYALLRGGFLAVIDEEFESKLGDKKPKFVDSKLESADEDTTNAAADGGEY